MTAARNGWICVFWLAAMVGTLADLRHAESREADFPIHRAIGVPAGATESDSLQIPLFPSASDPNRQGFARITNHSFVPGEVLIHAIDDDGQRPGPVRLEIAGRQSVQFNSDDLESGNPEKGLRGAAGRGEGDWRLELESALDLEIQAYVRTMDGFLTSMHDLVPRTEDGLRVAIFNPAENPNQVSSLRVINPGNVPADVFIEGVDDQGVSPGSGARLTLLPGASRTLTAWQLESGTAGLQGSLGDGTGKWRLSLTSEEPVRAMSLLSNPAGHLTNLSTAPASPQDGVHRVLVFPGALDPSGLQGFVRVINRSAAPGMVRVTVGKNPRQDYGSILMPIGANEAKQFNSDELVTGNAEKGLEALRGLSQYQGTGNWMLKLTSDLDIEVLSYIRTQDGFLTSMHDRVPQTGNRHPVVIFNPGRNFNQVSSLRIIASDGPAEVTVSGVDDGGKSPTSGVRLAIPWGTAVSFTAEQLESGADGLEGKLGDGTGKWRLLIDSGDPVRVMSLLSSPTGHLTNLSSAPGSRSRTRDSDEVVKISGWRTIATLPYRVAARAMQAVDLDDDGDVDVLWGASIEHGDSGVLWYGNLGGGSFSEEQPISRDADGVRAIDVSDIDGDDDRDVIFVTGKGYDDDKIAWHENLGGGAFSQEHVIAREAGAAWAVLRMADLDGDGDPDVLSSSHRNGKVAWYENRGQGSFSDERIISMDILEGSLEAADLDGDGDLDVLLGRTREAHIAWHENLGAGSFSEQRVIAAEASYPGSLKAADMDGDGDADLVWAAEADHRIAWHENLGGGRFSVQRGIDDDARGARSIQATDLDADGDLDLLCFLSSDQKIAWYENLGRQSFASARIVRTFAGSSLHLRAADLDDDGDLDVLSGGADFSWYENIGAVTSSIDVAVTAGVGQLWVSWSPVTAAGDGNPVHYRYVATAVSEDGRSSRTCIAIRANGCTVTGLAPDVEYRVTVHVEGGALRETTVEATPVADPTELTEFSDERVVSTGEPGNGIDVLHAVDLDGDGDPDLLAGSQYRHPLAWRENLGDGSFGDQRVISTDRISSVNAADLDGDGDRDLLSVSFDGGAISWYENLGAGSFSGQLPLAEDSSGARWANAADLDGDRDADVLVSSRGDDGHLRIAWYENLGPREFSGERLITEESEWAASVNAVDLDGDDDLDVLAGLAHFGTMEWYENLGGGRFSDKRIIQMDYRNQLSIHPADLDGDGDPDMLAAAIDHSRIAWYENLGDGSVSGERIVTENASWLQSVFIADLDGDDDQDVLFAAATGDLIGWHENLGDGRFSAERVISMEADGSWSVVAADLDSDGDLDVVGSNSSRDRILWFENLATIKAPTDAPAHVRVQAGVGQLWVTWDPLARLGRSQRANARYVVTAVSPDGGNSGSCIASNLIGCTVSGLASGVAYTVSVRAENLAGSGPDSAAVTATPIADPQPAGTSFSGQRVITTEADGASSVHAADLDGDGDLDVPSASQWDDTIAWYRNSGADFFPNRHHIATDASGAYVVAAADLDGDGDGDVLSGSWNDNKVAWYENMDAGAFSAQLVISMDVASADPLTVRDIDGDGDRDLLLGADDDRRLTWYENLADGTFARHHLNSDSDYTHDAVADATDLDGDGDLDVLTSSGFSDGFGWLENLGGGSFSAAQPITGGIGTAATLSGVDLDGDGDQDILHSTNSVDSVAWFENRGDGSFYGRRIITMDLKDITSVHAADLDGDGDLDIVAAAYEYDQVAWYENLGRGRFSGQRDIATEADGASDAFAADLDGDGDLDVLSASFRDDKIAWYENTGSNAAARDSDAPENVDRN